MAFYFTYVVVCLIAVQVLLPLCKCFLWAVCKMDVWFKATRSHLASKIPAVNLVKTGVCAWPHVCVSCSREVKVYLCAGRHWGPAREDIVFSGMFGLCQRDFFSPSPDLSCLFCLISLQNIIPHKTPGDHPHNDPPTPAYARMQARTHTLVQKRNMHGCSQHCVNSAHARASCTLSLI